MWITFFYCLSIHKLIGINNISEIKRAFNSDTKHKKHYSDGLQGNLSFLVLKLPIIKLSQNTKPNIILTIFINLKFSLCSFKKFQVDLYDLY